MAAHDAEQFEREWDALYAFLTRWCKPRSNVYGWGSGYDASHDRPNMPRWYTWALSAATSRTVLQTWNCPECRRVLVRLEAVQPIIVTYQPDESSDGERHEFEVHPGGLAFIASMVATEPEAAAVDIKAYRQTRGRRSERRAVALHTWGWWVRDLSPDSVRCWCPRCAAYRDVDIPKTT